MERHRNLQHRQSLTISAARSRRLPLAGQRETEPAGGVEDLLDRACQAADLAHELMNLPRAARLHAVRHDPRFHRATLLSLFVQIAEGALLDGDGAGADEAELATALAPFVRSDGRGRVAKAGALAQWLLGKARLRAGDLAGAAEAFTATLAFAEDLQAAGEEQGLAAAGRAQIGQDAGLLDEALDQFQEAALAFADAGARLPAAACLAESGFLLLGAGELAAARRNLKCAWALLDHALAPATAARVALACALCDAQLNPPPARSSRVGAKGAKGANRGNPGDGGVGGAGDRGAHDRGAAEPWLERARSLYNLPAPPREELVRAWSEGRIAAAIGRHAEAELALRGVRIRLLAHGSLSEAVTASCDTLSARFAAGQPLHVTALALELEQAFPDAGRPWALALRGLAPAAARGHAAYYAAANQLVARLAGGVPAAGRPDLLAPQRRLTDRLLRHHGELEASSGAAVCAVG